MNPKLVAALSLAVLLAGSSTGAVLEAQASPKEPQPAAAPRSLPKLPPLQDVNLNDLPGNEQAAPPSQVRPEEVFESEVTVAVAPIVARVVTYNGEPLLGLQPKDFVVRAGRKEIPLLAADWVSSAEQFPEEADPAEAGAGAGAPSPASPSSAVELLRKAGPPPGKLVLFFVQGDLEPVRIKGHLALLTRVEKLLSTVGERDHMALVSYDSKLRLRLDWTQDREAVREALRGAVRTGGDFSYPGDGSQNTSLAKVLDPETGAKAANPEKALELVADALAPLPGEKVVIFLGWGLGRATPQGMWYTRTFHRAAAKLNAARASVFVLDITHDDAHTLAVGLNEMAVSTGGTYASTYKFPDRAIKRLAQAISGYYVLTLDADDLPKDGAPLRIELRNQRLGVVLIRPAVASSTVVRSVE